MARKGFTLIELIVYLALVSSAATVLLGLEIAASRSTYLESALLTIHGQADRLLSTFSDDVAAATACRMEGELLVLEQALGRIEYVPSAGALERRVIDGTEKGNPQHFANIESTRFAIEEAGSRPLVTCEVTFAAPTGEGQVARKRFAALRRPRFGRMP
jgi:prepilin-type N-terminal cleavage/methylation domain-containing protein